MAVRVLDGGDVGTVLAWAAASHDRGCGPIGVPPGPVHPVDLAGEGLLSAVAVLRTPVGPVAVKAPGATPPGPAWLDPLDVTRREAAFYRAVATTGAGGAVPRLIAVAPAAGVVVMEGVEPTRRLDQAAGLGPGDLALVAGRLGALHRSLRPLSGRPGLEPFARTARWRAVLADCRATTPAFLAELGPVLGEEGTDLVRRLPGALPALAAAAADGTAGPPTVCSMDMRADNLLVAGDRLVFIDWQFAATAPGAVDLACLLSTGCADPVAATGGAIRTYAAAAGVSPAAARRGFVLGLVVRAAFAVPVVTLLPHPTPRARRLRRRAIERLGALLRVHAGEIRAAGLA